MSRSVRAALAALLICLPVHAQIVKVTQTDGKVVQGDLLGYENGKYRLRLAGGALQEIDEARVQDIVLLFPTGDRVPARDAGALRAARDAFERNDLDLAQQKISEALRSLDEDRSQTAELAARISTAYLERLLDARDPAKFAEGLRQVLPTLTPSARKEFFQKMADRFIDLDRTAPDNLFTAALGDALAGLADDGSIAEETRAALAEVFVARAIKESEKGEYGNALALFKGAARVDPKRREALKARLHETALARARALASKGDAAGARAAAAEAAAADPDDAEARKLLEDVEFATLKKKVEDGAGGSEIARQLQKFLEGNPKPDQKAWAEQALHRASTLEQPLSGQLGLYYPVKIGRTMVYRRGDGEFTERLRTDAVTHEGDVVRIFQTVQENYREYATSKSFLVEVEKDCVTFPTTGDEREPVLKFPAQAGDSWSWEVRGRAYKRTVKSLNETVTVGREGATRVYADCLAVEFSSTVDRDGATVTMTSRSLYAPGVGLVKLEYPDAEFRQFNLELIEVVQE
jgi:hypothetical protein